MAFNHWSRTYTADVTPKLNQRGYGYDPLAGYIAETANGGESLDGEAVTTVGTPRSDGTASGGELRLSRVAKVFDLASQSWQTKNRLISRIEGESERLLRLIGNYSGARRVLDIGAGAGKAALTVRRHNPAAHLPLCDISKSMLARASTHLGDVNVYYLVADAASIPLPDSVFDLVLIQQVLHHVRDPHSCLAGSVTRARERRYDPGVSVQGRKPN